MEQRSHGQRILHNKSGPRYRNNNGDAEPSSSCNNFNFNQQSLSSINTSNQPGRQENNRQNTVPAKSYRSTTCPDPDQDCYNYQGASTHSKPLRSEMMREHSRSSQRWDVINPQPQNTEYSRQGYNKQGNQLRTSQMRTQNDMGNQHGMMVKPSGRAYEPNSGCDKIQSEPLTRFGPQMVSNQSAINSSAHRIVQYNITLFALHTANLCYIFVKFSCRRLLVHSRLSWRRQWGLLAVLQKGSTTGYTLSVGLLHYYLKYLVSIFNYFACYLLHLYLNVLMFCVRQLSLVNKYYTCSQISE